MKIERATENTWKFWCPGCDSAHVISDAWQVDTATATIIPSVLVHSHQTLIDDGLTGDALTDPVNVTNTPQCHSFITNGQIQYLPDSTHPYAGLTVELPDWPHADRETIRLLHVASAWIADAVRDDPSGEPWLMARTLLNEMISRVDLLGGWPQ